MSRGTGSSGSADERHEHALHHEFGGGHQVGILRVLGAQIRLPVLHHVGLQRALAVDERRHHLPVPCLRAVLQQHQVTVEDAFADHRVARDPKGEGAGRGLQLQLVQVHRDAALRLRFPVLPEPGGDAAVDRDFSGAATRRHGHRAKRTGLAGVADQRPLVHERVDVTGRRVGVAEAEVRRDLPQAGAWVAVLHPIGDEIENGTLLFGGFNHYWSIDQ